MEIKHCITKNNINDALWDIFVVFDVISYNFKYIISLHPAEEATDSVC